MHQDFRRDVQLCSAFLSPVNAKRLLCCLVVFGLTMAVVAPSSATPINHGDFPAADVTFQQITESPNPGDGPELFGEPVTSGNSLIFSPTNFGASAGVGAGVDMTGGGLTFEVLANAGQSINNIQLTESGDVSLTGTGDDNTTATIAAFVVVSIHEVDGAGINVLSTSPQDLIYSPAGGTYGLGTAGGGGPSFDAPWTGTAFIDLNQVLTDNGIPFTSGVTRATVNFQNTLAAVSQDGTSASISKNSISVSTNIPEPTAIVLAVFGLVAASLSWRRSR